MYSVCHHKSGNFSAHIVCEMLAAVHAKPLGTRPTEVCCLPCLICLFLSARLFCRPGLQSFVMSIAAESAPAKKGGGTDCKMCFCQL